ncbi:MAG TPA: hypothetical protein VFN51_00145, partial [Candidatus Saccharimonadales bacterium]|nr:hypothetical protein [Candidatus Saccharimonadales bacterium]
MIKNADKAATVLAYYWKHVRPHKRMTIGTLISVPFTVLVNSFLPSLIVANVLSQLSQQSVLHRHLSYFLPVLGIYFVILFIG